MNKVIIYRVESKHTARGFYNNGHFWIEDEEIQKKWQTQGLPLWFYYCSNHESQHPSPSRSGIHFFSDHQYFGFANVDDLFNWFGEEFLVDLFEGEFSEWFEVVTYKVDEVHVRFGKGQACFVKSQAVRL